MSTTEQELDALVEGLKDLFNTCGLLEDMDVKIKSPHAITDLKGAYDIVRNPGVTKRSAHFDRRLHYARDNYLKESFRLFLIGTNKMMADGLTKVVDRDKFFRCRNYMMNVS